MAQRGGHHEELARHIEVELLHQIDVREVLVRDEGDRNVAHVHLVLLDEVNQQVERTLECLELDVVRVRRRFEFFRMFSHSRSQSPRRSRCPATKDTKVTKEKPQTTS